MRRRFLALLLASACADAPGDPQDPEDTSGGPVDLPAPAFTGLVDAELHVELTRANDLLLDVSAVEVGRTVLLVDGQSVGSLIEEAPIGKLGDQQLRLHLRGAMVASRHSLQLRTFDEVESESSEPVDIVLDAVSPPEPTWAPLGEPLGTGDAFVAGGPGSRGVLALVDFEASVPRLLAWPLAARGWDPAARRVLALPGLRPGTYENLAAVAAMRLGSDSAPTLRVAWRVDAPGTAIAAVEVTWNGDEAGTPTQVLVPDTSWLGAREWVDVSRPVLAGDLLLTEIVAPRDVEQARPGDRVVASVALARVDEPGEPRLLKLGEVDIDRVGHVVEPLVDAYGHTDSLIVRRDLREPVVLDVDREARTVRRRSTELDARNPAWTVVADAPATSIAAFGSRIAAAMTGDGETLVVGLTNDSGGSDPRLLQTQLADAPATGAAVLAWIEGVPIVLVPRGPADVLAMAITEDAPDLQPLPGLACDAIATQSIAVLDVDGRTAIACLRERELRLVTLAL